ncbi:MAG: DUF547 domain-containing protein [Bdellovibrionota bacterium]
MFALGACRETRFPTQSEVQDFESQPNSRPLAEMKDSWTQAHQALQTVFNQIVIEDSGYSQVFYNALISSDPHFRESASGALKTYLDFVSGLNPRELLGPSPNEVVRNFKKAFWINFYNACVIDTVAKNFFAIQSDSEGINGLNIWDRPLCAIGGGRLSLNQIENGVLRNAESRKLISPSDLRALPPSLKTDTDVFEHRIHFALNCASGSCPRLSRQVFSDTNIEAQLAELESEFWTSGREAVSPHRLQARVSGDKLLINPIAIDWYRVDFPKDLVEYLRPFHPELRPDSLGEFTYNWSPNLASEANESAGFEYQESWPF